MDVSATSEILRSLILPLRGFEEDEAGQTGGSTEDTTPELDVEGGVHQQDVNSM